MALTHLGTLPVTAINIGLAATPTGLGYAGASLAADIASLAPAVVANATIAATFPPNVVGLAAGLTAHLDPTTNLANLAQSFNPANWVSASGDASIGLAVELGLIETELSVAEALVASLKTGLGAGALAAWAYAGRAEGWGSSMTDATGQGTATIRADSAVSGVVFGSASYSNWSVFSGGFNTGGSDATHLPQTTAQESLTRLGELAGGELATGIEIPLLEIDAYLLKLRGLRAAITAQIQLAAGVNLPDPQLIVDAGLGVDVSAVVGDILNIQIDFGAEIAGIQLEIDALLQLAIDVNATLSGGGLSVWRYSGLMGSFGEALSAETGLGLPGVGGGVDSSLYGFAILSASATDWNAFGEIVIT